MPKKYRKPPGGLRVLLAQRYAEQTRLLTSFRQAHPDPLWFGATDHVSLTVSSPHGLPQCVRFRILTVSGRDTTTQFREAALESWTNW
jgi:hypothetical protein